MVQNSMIQANVSRETVKFASSAGEF